MKKRIIAAMTALVMVVTMIPANAFASSVRYGEDDVVALIKDAAGMSGESCAMANFAVKHNDASKAKIDLAKEAYNKLTEKEKISIETKWEKNRNKTVSYQDLLVAEELYKYQGELIDKFDSEVAKLTEESLKSDNGTSFVGTIQADVKAAYDSLGTSIEPIGVAIVNGKAVRTVAGASNDYVKASSVAPKNIVSDKEFTDKATYVLAHKVLGDAMGVINSKFAEAVQAINAVTEEVVNDITVDPATYTLVSTATNKIGAATGFDAYFKYAKNYRNT